MRSTPIPPWRRGLPRLRLPADEALSRFSCPLHRPRRQLGRLFRRQLSGGHDDALDVRAHLGENALHVKIFAHGSSYYGVARRAPAHRTTSAICLDRETCPAARRGCRAFPPRCLALGFQFIAMPARYEFADPLTLISARRTLTCRRNGLSRCCSVMPQLPTLWGSLAQFLDDG